MPMIKVIPPGSYDYGQQAAQLIKVASTGLRGGDLDALIKRAGHEFADKVKKASFDKGEIPVHLIALGATEAVGPNRNGDGFKIAACRKYHDTFVKHAKFYRNHKNKDPKKSYGVVKMSMYNEPMRRIELLVALNGTKEAAARNDGFVADKEVEALEKGAEIGVSMACKVAYDVCSACNNRAKNRDYYCLGTDEGGTCKYGGLKNNIGIVHENGHHLHADNPHPMFFDISNVFRPADRIAFITGKVASSGVVGGAELAEVLGVSAPPDLLDGSDYGSDVFRQIKIARELAARERGHRVNDYDRALTTYTGVDGIEEFSHYQREGVLRALVEEKIALSLADWLKLTTGECEEKIANVIDEIKPCLSTVFSELAEDPELPELIRNNPCKAGAVASPGIRMWATKYAADCSLDNSVIQRRVWRAALRQNELPVAGIKSAHSSSEAARQLARQYAVYQVGFLHDLGNDPEIDLTMDLLVRQNRVQ